MNTDAHESAKIEPWHLGYYRFDAYEFGWLICGSMRYAYVSLRHGGLIELPVTLTPGQARDFIHCKRVAYTTVLAPCRTFGMEVREVVAHVDLMPPKRRTMRYADRTNAYAAAKRGARCKGWQGQAREQIEWIKKYGKGNPHLASAYERATVFLHQAWLEAWGYLPWMAGQGEDSTRFAAQAFGPPPRRNEIFLAPPEQWEKLLAPWRYRAVEADELGMERLEELAKIVNASVRDAEEDGWPMLDFADEATPRLRY